MATAAQRSRESPLDCEVTDSILARNQWTDKLLSRSVLYEKPAETRIPYVVTASSRRGGLKIQAIRSEIRASATSATADGLAPEGASQTKRFCLQVIKKRPRKKFCLQVIKKRPRKPDVADDHEWCSAATACKYSLSNTTYNQNYDNSAPSQAPPSIANGVLGKSEATSGRRRIKNDSWVPRTASKRRRPGRLPAVGNHLKIDSVQITFRNEIR
ncbi:hypothetical protein EVAR_60068_1 [Eumeta japonica]|uniref:Uncharacterized protein n=1 Tax=Eumeta variegata TaxID=151549 RepID=A0A4C1ZHS2_EUMVA|nr:hypothetical protein EVAR_60068_1 [Eumeta japonica]